MRLAIVDDEPPARRLLREMLESHADIEIVAELGNGREAVAGLIAARPDVVFLDIQLPDIDGFRVLAELPAEQMPVVVLVTAHRDFALRAFDVEAVDYLLKPFDDERLERALARARARRASPGSAGSTDYREVLRLLEQMRTTERYLSRLPIKSGERVVLLPVGEIAWIGAEGKYAWVHVVGKAHLVRDTLGRLESLLDPSRFLRISRYALVNLDRVREIQRWFHGDYTVFLHGEDKGIQSTRGYREGLERLLRREPGFARRG